MGRGMDIRRRHGVRRYNGVHRGCVLAWRRTWRRAVRDAIAGGGTGRRLSRWLAAGAWAKLSAASMLAPCYRAASTPRAGSQIIWKKS